MRGNWHTAIPNRSAGTDPTRRTSARRDVTVHVAPADSVAASATTAITATIAA
jgi:hypothetical protein